VKVDRFTHHSDTASTVRQYYDKNNNVEAREVLGQTEEELDNEEDEEQERTLLEEIEHERSNVE
jgi:Ran GTPase-activating protein (RanGAP) involved in mRNA processing and transport